MASREQEPIFFCQGGVLVREIGDSNLYTLLEPLPSCGLNVGDMMPQEWSLAPANEAARRLLADEIGG